MNINLEYVILVLPIILPLLTAALGLLFLHYPKVQIPIGMTGMGLHFISTVVLFLYVSREGILAVTMGNWPAPFGITLVADQFSVVMVLMVGLMGLLVLIYALGDINRQQIQYGFHPLFQVLLMGVCGAFLTGDLFNLYVWFEVMLISAFVLLVLGGKRSQIEGAVKYVTLNLLASFTFLSAIGILYGKVGTLNMADLAQKLEHFDEPHLITTLSLMFMVAFGIKAGLFPLFFWLPAAYHTPKMSITTIFSALLTKVGVYALVRMFTLVFTQDPEYNQQMFIFLASLTMVTGVLGAVAQYDFRRLLSFHIISQIGYLVMGLAIGTPLAFAATLFFMVHVIFAKSALFLISGIANNMRGTYNLKALGSLYAKRPFLAVLFIVSALSLAGLPPFPGFFAKFALVRSGLEASQITLVVVALCVSILTLYSMVKIWTEAFWKTAPENIEGVKPLEPLSTWLRYTLYTPLTILVLLMIAMSIWADPLFTLCLQAGEQLVNPQYYIEAVKLSTS